ncbi:MAG: type II 3-dehydroquinate dehydratase [Candidatus Omnitrophica bacterium]|nr:type II 3-dehydroquinate dehydratase [Candidatus Omnitrophota bacterium]
MKKILVIHGPNLNLLGKREPGVYGKTTLPQINSVLKALAAKLKVKLTIKQSNVEGEIVDFIQGAENKFDGILINPAAYTHTSVAIRDAIAVLDIKVVEVHLSNIYSREEFRHKSLISPVASGTILGFGAKSYTLGLAALLDLISAK